MKKVVIVTGSPRANGNTNAMAAKFAEVAKATGAEVTRAATSAGPTKSSSTAG